MNSANKQTSKPTQPCAVCKSEASFFVTKDGFDEYMCPTCDLSFVYPQPEMKFLSEEVYSAKSGYQANKSTDLSTTVPTYKQKKLLKYLSQRPVGTFLDVGCSSGELMYLAKKLGYHVIGVELNARTVNIARQNGLKVYQGTLDSLDLSPGSLDIIHMGDLLEHVPDPRALIDQAKKLLKPNGELIILTPNTDCFWSHITKKLYEWFGIPWSLLTPPHHLFQFSISNLTKLVSESGFEVKNAWYTRTPTLKYELGNLHLLNKWKKSKTVGNLLFMVGSFGLYTIVFGINRIIELLPTKKFAMAIVATKK